MSEDSMKQAPENKTWCSLRMTKSSPCHACCIMPAQEPLAAGCNEASSWRQWDLTGRWEKHGRNLV
jgi:hypothetical protein